MKNRSLRFLIFILSFIVVSAGAVVVSCKVSFSKTYTVSPKTKPCDKTAKSANYNKNTKHYYMLRSYLNKIAKSKKGGTLVLTAGTYNCPNTLFVGSNTHIVLKKNAVIKKTDVGGQVLPPSTTIFQFIRFDKKDTVGVYGGHEGEHDISITGEGVIDQNFIAPELASVAGVGIIMGHNTNVTLDGITLKNNCFGHLIEMDACKNVTIKNCTFTGYAPSGKFNKEAINLDVPDPDRDGFNAQWSIKDKTPNENITIENCVFDTLETGIGTHRYTGDVYQIDVKIINNTFLNCQTALRIVNYRNCTISNNTFKDCSPNSRYPFVMFFAGLRGIDFSYNSFENCGYDENDPVDGKYHQTNIYLMRFYWEGTYDAGQTIYEPVYSELTAEEAQLFMTNTAVHCGRMVVYSRRLYPIDFTGHTDPHRMYNNGGGPEI